jgi:hypothetical protein
MTQYYANQINRKILPSRIKLCAGYTQNKQQGSNEGDEKN